MWQIIVVWVDILRQNVFCYNVTDKNCEAIANNFWHFCLIEEIKSQSDFRYPVRLFGCLNHRLAKKTFELF